MNRQASLQKLNIPDQSWDVIVIGGGASGLGIVVDAASRGLRTVLFEAEDFAKGTSSRSTKLVHGGVRYLAQGQIALVREALRERGYLAQNARHLVHDQRFIIPCYRWWEKPLYRIGLGLYDLMAGALRFGKTRCISRDELLALAPNTKAEGLRGGVTYHDGRFDDARLAIELARTALDHGACVVNHMPVTALLKDGTGSVIGVQVRDGLSGNTFKVRGKAIVNATGVFTNEVMAMDGPDEKDHVVPSQGIHLVVDRSFLPGNEALMIPRTTDGRVLFAIPWHDHAVLGTTDTLVKATSLEPRPLEAEIDLVLDNAARYLARHPTRADVKCMYAGLRPLAAPRVGGRNTKEISRGHKVITSTSGLISLIGGKWTTYRKMAEDVVDLCIRNHGLAAAPCRTRTLSVHGNVPSDSVDHTDRMLAYGSEAPAIRALMYTDPALGQRIHPDHPFTAAEVVYAVRHEMACTVEDVLARRVRLLFIDAKAASDSAEQVARLMAVEAGHSEEWIQGQITAFRALAQGYVMPAIP